jgi:hypothetical protein
MTASVMRSSDFSRDDRRIDVLGKHMPTDNPSRRTAEVGTDCPVLRRGKFVRYRGLTYRAPADAVTRKVDPKRPSLRD